MSDRLSVALLSHLASAGAPTGAERSLSLLAAGLAGRGHRIRLVTPGPSPLLDGLSQAGVEVSRLPCRVCWLAYYHPRPIPVAALKWARFALPDAGEARLRSFFRKTRPDVVHVNCLPHLRGARSARREKIPVVWHLREILPAGARRRWFAGHLSRNADRIVAVSEAVAEWVRAEGLGGRLDVVHNGVSLAGATVAAAQARRELGLPEEGTLIGLFGQLREHKGGVEFVRAARAALDRCGELRFVLAGAGPDAYLSRLRGEIAADPRGRIHLLPPQADARLLLAAADAVCVPSLTPDPLPRSILESMAVGRPAIASSSGGAPELIVDGRTGLLVRPGNLDEMARAFVRVAEEPALRSRLGAAARARAVEAFSLEGHVDRMERVLESAVKR